MRPTLAVEPAPSQAARGRDSFIAYGQDEEVAVRLERVLDAYQPAVSVLQLACDGNVATGVDEAGRADYCCHPVSRPAFANTTQVKT
jgi:hypothetical protein